jgi:TolB-like protein
MATVGRRLSVIVCAEMVGYSRLVSSAAFPALMAIKAHREAIDAIFAEEGGCVVQTAGDRVLLEFPGALEALCAAQRVQRVLAECNAKMPSENRLALRIGINLGDASTDALAAELVDAAVQLQEMAEPGGIRLSQTALAAIHGNIDVLVPTGGAQIPPSVAAPTPASDPAPDLAPPRSRSVLSLVVLPFATLSKDARQQELVAGITEHLTRELARIDRSVVIDRNTALAYRGDSLDIPAIGAALGVRYVIKGSVRDSGTGLRVIAELIDAETGEDLWIDRFEMLVGEPLAMQRDAVARLIPPLQAQLLAADGRPPQPLLLDPSGEFRATIVTHPRGAPIAPNVRAPTPGPTSLILPAPASPAPNPPPLRRTLVALRTLIKVLVVVLTGVLAIGVLGARYGAVVEAISWMLVAAGAVQIVGAITEAPPEG